MFCYQCEQSKLNKHCTEIGVCGKTPQVAALQDLMVHVIKGVCLYSHRAHELGVSIPQETYSFTFSTLFSTLTNVNFDPDRFLEYIAEGVSIREQLREQYEEACKNKGVTPKQFEHSSTTWLPPNGMMGDVEVMEAEGHKVSVQNDVKEYGADVHGVRQMVIYGLKGLASYARHAELLGQFDPAVGEFVHETLAFLIDGDETERHDLGANLGLALKVGEVNIRVMELLDKGHCTRFGSPEPTSVNLIPKEGKAILVSGHDMNDMEAILKATENTGINVYTHGEMLPAHSYPELKKYKHLVGHWGGAWQLQKFEWADFPGPILVTTNCIIEPMKSYRDRLFTLNEVGWPDIPHIDVHKDGMAVVIDNANKQPGFTAADTQKDMRIKTLTIGFGHDAIIANAGKVIDAIKTGKLKRIFVVGGCDGRENKRKYFTQFTQALSDDTMILTLGCAKYRFNHLDFGNLSDTGLPRLLDLGQCNDTYTAILAAQALADAFGTDVNHLPLSISLAWMEQKAIAVLLSLLSLGIQNIRLGPVLPAFLTPKVTGILVDKFKISLIDNKNPQADLDKMMQE